MSSYPTNFTDNHGQVIEKFLDVQEQVSSQEHCERNQLPFENGINEGCFQRIKLLTTSFITISSHGRIRVHEGTTHSKYLEKILSL